jgi:hypothetical protein
MAHDCRISFLVLEAQKRIFRLAERNHGLRLKTISLDSGIPYNSVRGYAAGDTIMPVPALLKLVTVIPDYLLSHLLDPVGKCLADSEGDDGDHDSLATNCIDFTAAHAAARHPNSPKGVDIAPCEDKDLRAKRATLRRIA